ILNQKRESLTQIEIRYNFRVHVFGDDKLISPDMRLERVQGRSAAPETEDLTRDAIIIDQSNDSAASSKDDTGKEATKSRRPRRRRKNVAAKKNDDKNQMSNKRLNRVKLLRQKKSQILKRRQQETVPRVGEEGADEVVAAGIMEDPILQLQKITNQTCKHMMATA
ncbi:MAG: hypothetical protein ACJ0HT_06125, partial [Alphaproteobacteria bacterium]